MRIQRNCRSRDRPNGKQRLAGAGKNPRRSEMATVEELVQMMSMVQAQRRALNHEVTRLTAEN